MKKIKLNIRTLPSYIDRNIIFDFVNIQKVIDIEYLIWVHIDMIFVFEIRNNILSNLKRNGK